MTLVLHFYQVYLFITLQIKCTSHFIAISDGSPQPVIDIRTEGMIYYHDINYITYSIRK